MGRAEKRLAEAVSRVLSRHVITRAAGSFLPVDQFVREVTAEIVRDLDKRTARNIQAALAAADQVLAFTPPEPPPTSEQQQEPEAHGPPLEAGVPRWHPEHPLNSDSRET